MRKIDFLNSILKDKIDVGDAKTSKIKRSVLRKIFDKYLDVSESTNGKVMNINHCAGVISYSYQRHDLEFKADNWLKFLYNYDCDVKSDGTFFSCGIASISTLLTILIKHNYKNFVFTNIPYFESYDYLSNYFDAVNLKEIKYFHNNEKIKTDVLWIDSASPDFLSLDYKNIDAKIIICDTSCLDCSNNYIKNLVDFVIKTNKQLFLVRSHMKLDCFSLEINRLGSVVAVNDDEILTDVKELKTKLGNNTTVQNIYPWLGNADFFKLTSKDVAYTNKINNLIESELRKILDTDKYDIVHFDHCMYFTIRLKKFEGDFNILNLSVSDYCKKFDLPVNTCSSFYLEKIGIDNFIRRLDNDSKFLRISSTKIKKKDAINIAKRVGEYLNSI